MQCNLTQTHKHTHAHSCQPPIHCAERMHRIGLVMFMRCWELLGWQLSVVLPKPVNMQDHNMLQRRTFHEMVTSTTQRQGSAVTAAINVTCATCMRKHAWKRQSWNEGKGGWMIGKAEVGRYRWAPLSRQRPYFQIRWGSQLSWGWRLPPQAGLRGTLDWTSKSDLRMPHVGHRLHRLSAPFQLGQAPWKTRMNTMNGTWMGNK